MNEHCNASKASNIQQTSSHKNPKAFPFPQSFSQAFEIASNTKPSKHAIDIIVYSYVFACRTIKPTRDCLLPRDVQFPVYRWWIAWKTIQLRCWEIFYITKYISCNTTLMTINRHWKGWKHNFLFRVTLIDEHSPLNFQGTKYTKRGTFHLND